MKSTRTLLPAKETSLTCPTLIPDTKTLPPDSRPPESAKYPVYCLPCGQNGRPV
ncbi:Uncharacterised protein [Mycobacteroides abscessus subsp. abscessus]|nr:Uncharacterised protein [Mycobacteroides abscessus subsp. abscessus]